MSLLSQALDRIETWLVERYPRIGLYLQEGLSRAEIDEIMKDYFFSLPQELYDFYGWHNGSTDTSDVIPPFDYFPSLQKALAKMADFVSWDFHWNENWLPILNINGGDVECAMVVGKEAAPIWHIDRKCGIREIVWNSFTDYVLAIAECYQTGAYYLDEVDEDGYIVESHFEQQEKIFQKYNYHNNKSVNSIIYDISGKVNLHEISGLSSLSSLEKYLFNSDADVFSTAVRALANTRNPKVIKTLIELLETENLPYIVYKSAIKALKILALYMVEVVEAIDTVMDFFNNQAQSFPVNEYDELTIATLGFFANVDDQRTTDILVKYLEDRENFLKKDSDDRYVFSSVIWQVIKALSNRQYPHLIDIVIELLHDSKRYVRLQTLSCLNYVKDKRVNDLFDMALSWDIKIWRKLNLIRLMGEREDSRAIKPLIAILNNTDANKNDRLHALQIAKSKFFSQQEEVINAVTKMKEDKNIQISHQAEFVFNKNQDAKANKQSTDKDSKQSVLENLSEKTNKLIKCVFDANVTNSLNAIRKLGDLGNPLAIKPLIKILETGKSYPVIYSSVIQSLGKLKAVEAINPICDFWEKQGKSFQKYDYDDLTLSKFKAFAQIEDEKATTAMVEFLRDRDHILDYTSSGGFVSCSCRIMEIIIPALWERKYRNLTSILTQLLQDSDAQIRSSTLSAIIQINDEAIDDLFTLVLSDEQMHIRSTATAALADRKDARAIVPLIKILKEGDNYTRLMKFETLHHLEISRNKQVVDTVIDLLQDENINIRCGAALFLGEIKEKRAIVPLSECLNDQENPMVRKVIQKVFKDFFSNN